MPCPIYTKTNISISNFFLISSFLFNGVIAAAHDCSTGIGAIIDVNSRIGKEENISMEIAIQTFNKASNNKYNLSLHVVDSSGKALQASMAADDLIRGKQVQAIVGMETWSEAAWVAEIANQAQVPILSFIAPSITSPLTSVRWPFLLRMTTNDSLQIQCVASIVGSYGWRRVIGIYEDDGINTDSGTLVLLSNALQTVDAEIEHWSAFPPRSTLSDPKAYIQDELKKLNSKQSRVFIILRSSLDLATHILLEANEIGLMGRHSVWIATDTVASLLDTIKPSLLSSMQGLIGIKTHFSDTSPSFEDFSIQFRYLFRSSYPEEVNSEPGIYALRAYDTISTVALAVERSSNFTNRSSNATISGALLLDNILSSNFSGLSGAIRFEDGELSRSTTYEIVNVVGNRYTRLKFWSPEFGFKDDLFDETSRENNSNGGGGGTVQVLGGRVYWLGHLNMVPLGWVMPSKAVPLIIGVPVNNTFENFLNVKDGDEPTGFCIDVFKSAVELLKYDLPHKFEAYNGSYDELVDQVYSKRYGAVVGDITILADRSDHVQFTQPYAESSLSIVVAVKPGEKAWLIVKPFNGKLWIVVSIVFLYTMFVIWFLEHRSNPDFRGPWKNQISTTMWFTCSTLFFAHWESVRSNYTRVVMYVWFFTVFVVRSSYTASLTSMLTVKSLEPVTDINMLSKYNTRVGCDNASFVKKYLKDVLHYPSVNIIPISGEEEIFKTLTNGTINAAFLESPYAKIFLAAHPKDYYLDARLDHRLGGFGFAFPKGSPMATEFSKAFLQLSEGGKLNELDQTWFKLYSPRSTSDNDMTLTLDSFWALFLATGLTSTVTLLLYIVHVHISFPPSLVGCCNVLKRLTNRDPSSVQARDVEVLMSSNAEYSSDRGSGHPQSNPAAEIEISETYIGDSNYRARALTIANSFPGPNGRIQGWKHI